MHFTRLNMFEDPYEGVLPRPTVEAMRAAHSRLAGDPVLAEENLKPILSGFKDLSTRIAVNCWHRNEFESDAMWRLYVGSNEGVAISTTVGRLKKSILCEQPVFIGDVRYIDYQSDGFILGNFFEVCLHKRSSFVHEQEVRAVTFINYNDPTQSHGIDLGVRPDQLIETIHIAPTAAQWFVDLVPRLMKRLGYDFTVDHSKLYRLVE